MLRPNRWLWLTGITLLGPYLAAWWLVDLRQNTVEFVIVFFVAFALYAVATIFVLRRISFPEGDAQQSGLSQQLFPDGDDRASFSRGDWLAIFALAIAMNGILLQTWPTLSDDMYRYVWDGRVQANGVSPYRFAPGDEHLLELQDEVIWPMINRKTAITVYPAAAELSFALFWHIWPDSVGWFQSVMAGCALLSGWMLIGLLRDLGKSTTRAVIYLWSPLLIFETAHGAHVDGLVLPVLIGTWWARVKERDWLVGALLGLATAIKLYPILLFPALWRPNHRSGRWQMPLAFLITLGTVYLPYLISDGAGVLGFLPSYFKERFNVGLADAIKSLLGQAGLDANLGLMAITLTTLALLALWMVWKPAVNAESALRRCLWIIGAFTLLTQNLFSWYLLWMLPLIAIFIQPGKMSTGEAFGLRGDSWTGWWLFSGLIALSYTFFIDWTPVPWAIWAQFIPLYLLLLLDLIRRLYVTEAGIENTNTLIPS